MLSTFIGFLVGMAVEFVIIKIASKSGKSTEKPREVVAIGDNWYEVPVGNDTELWHVDSLDMGSSVDKTIRASVLRVTRDDGEYYQQWESSCPPKFQQLCVAHHRAVRLKTLKPPPSATERSLQDTERMIRELTSSPKA